MIIQNNEIDTIVSFGSYKRNIIVFLVNNDEKYFIGKDELFNCVGYERYYGRNIYNEIDDDCDDRYDDNFDLSL